MERNCVWRVVAPCEIVCKFLGILPLFMGNEMPCWKKWINGGHLLLIVALITRAIWHCLPMELVLHPGSTVVQHSGALMTVVYYAQPYCGVITSRLVRGQIYEIFKNIDVVQKRFESLGYMSGFRKERYVIITSTVCATLGSSYLLVLYTVCDLIIDTEYIIETIFLTLHCSMTCVYASSISYLLFEQFILINYAISKNFPKNKLLSVETSNTSKSKDVACDNEEQQLAMLDNVKIIVDKLHETVDLVNHTLSIQVRYADDLSMIDNISFLIVSNGSIISIILSTLNT